jgi:hypothetical protein
VPTDDVKRLAGNWPWAKELAAAFARLATLPQPTG